MSVDHNGGNIQNAILVEEHQGDINAKRVVSIETSPTDTTKVNPSLVLAYTGTDLTTVTKTIGGVQYQKTLGYSGGVLVTVSAWVAI